jgi:hypothetical protein
MIERRQSDAAQVAEGRSMFAELSDCAKSLHAEQKSFMVAEIVRPHAGARRRINR